MFQAWRIKLRQAEEAFRQGRLEEAGRLACQGNLQEFLPAQKLLRQVANRLADRGRRRAADGETSAGWHDLELAAQLGADTDAVGQVRQQLVSSAAAEVESYLAADEPQAALSRLEALTRRQAAGRELRELHQVALDLDQARRLARQGRFAEAEERLAAAASLRPDLSFLQERLAQCREQASRGRLLAEQVHHAIGAEDWTAAHALAEEWLTLAPECPEAREARRRAWRAVGGTQPSPPQPGPAVATLPLTLAAAAGRAAGRSTDVVLAREAGPRFLLWIDGVGGYLVCEGSEVVLGQPVRGAGVDIPILGDVSQQHAVIRRDGEGYLIDPRRPTRLEGLAIDGPAPLADGHLIDLGDRVRLRFRRPHPLSATARLEFVSHHRTQPSADAVLLLAETLVLGPGENCHIPCRDWSRELVLFRQGADLCCRREGRFDVDGTSQDGQATITRGSRISGDDFSLSLEALT